MQFSKFHKNRELGKSRWSFWYVIKMNMYNMDIKVLWPDIYHVILLFWNLLILTQSLTAIKCLNMFVFCSHFVYFMLLCCIPHGKRLCVTSKNMFHLLRHISIMLNFNYLAYDIHFFQSDQRCIPCKHMNPFVDGACDDPVLSMNVWCFFKDMS